MKEVKVDIKDLENFLNYLQDKVEDCYKRAPANKTRKSPVKE